MISAEAISIELAHPTLTVNEDRLRQALVRTLEGEAVGVVELNVILADHTTVLDLNREYLSHDYETDVLSFSFLEDQEPEAIEGEVYVDLDTAMERHEEFDATFEDEAIRYTIHGLLHLIGYTDETEAEKEVMHRLEERYLGG